MGRALTLSPLLAAISFTVNEALTLMQRPDTIYLPILFEMLLFGVGCVVYGTINAVILTPLAAVLASFTRLRIAGFVLAVGAALLIGQTVAASGLYDTGSFFGRDNLFNVLLPVTIAGFASFYFMTQRTEPADRENKDQYTD